MDNDRGRTYSINVSIVLLFTILSSCSAHRHPENQLVIMQTEAPRSMDPADHTATYTTAVLNPMYEGLTHFDEQLNVRPSLATAWRADETGTEWTVTLRSAVSFHDGMPLDAAAVVASFNRLLDPARGLAGASSFRQVIKKVEIVDSANVRFTLKRPYAAFPSLLTVAKIVSPKEDGKRDLGRYAVGTGPFRFSEWKTGEYVLETRNERYWGAKSPMQQLKWIWTSEPALMNMALLAGEADLVNPLPPIFAEALQHDSRVALVKGQSSAVFWIALNTKSKPLADVRVRQALNYATDRESLIASQLRGYGLPANSPLAPADFGYDEQVKGYGYDLPRAAALLAEAGYRNGFTLNVAVQESQSNIVQAVAGMWAKVNITLNTRQMEGGVFSQAIFGDPQQKAEAGIQGVFASWTSASLDPEQQLGPLYRTSSWSPAGANLGFYSNTYLDLLLDEAAAELDNVKRKALYTQAQQIISDDVPHVLLYYSKDLAARRKALTRFWLFPGGQIEMK